MRTRSLPLNRCWRLRGDVVADTVDALDLVDDAVGYPGQDIVGHVVPVRRHEVGGRDGAQHADILVSPVIAHDADGPHRRQEDGEGLADLLVVACASQLLQVDRVRCAEGVRVLLRHFADDADAKARPGEGVAHHGVLVQAKLPAEGADLVLEEQAQGLEHAHLHVLRQAAHVVVRLDGRGRPAVGGGLDDVGVERALQQHALLGLQPHVLDRLLEGLDEEAPDDLPLPLGLRDARELRVEALRGVDHPQLQAWDVLLEPLLHALRLVLPQQPCVYQEGPEALADGPVHQRRGDAGVHAPAHGPDDVAIPELAQDPVHLELREVVHVPGALAAADPQHEVLDQLGAARSVCHLWVELHAPHPARLALHSREFAAGRVGDLHEGVGKLGHLVPVAHPDLHLVLADALEERANASGLLRIRGPRRRQVCPDAELGVAEFALGAGLDLATVAVAHLLQAVADAEDGQPLLLQQLPDVAAEVRGVGVVDGVRAAAEDDALRAEGGHLLRLQEAGPELAVDARLPDAATDEVADLRAEVDDEDALLTLRDGVFAVRGRH
mmetsp:Transcript_100609/g.225510  ORF Transcript_100609/g.225510 Transcript_100609/m.225510 type:complete len:554 (+) Transcript_100609:73-1734(+)